MLAITNRISIGTTLVSGLEAVGIESTLVHGWVCTCWVGRGWAWDRILIQYAQSEETQQYWDEVKPVIKLARRVGKVSRWVRRELTTTQTLLHNSTADS